MLNKTNTSCCFQNHLHGSHVPLLLSYLLLSDEVRDILQWLLFSVTCQAVDTFGVVTNIINVICFVQQGFKDPVNVSLLGLAISDLGCLTTLIWSNICLTPAFNLGDLPFDPIEFQHLTSAWPHATFTRITSWITALITLERCLCITIPLKVKLLITPKRVFIAIVLVYVILISSISPMYVIYSLGMKYFPEKNKTLIGLVATEDRSRIEPISFAVNNLCIPFSAFTVNIVCTIILVIKLHISAGWKHEASNYGQSGASNRNLKVAKMVVMISTLFIVCSLPLSAIFIGILMESELSLDGKYRNMVFVLLGLCVLLESVNSSVNIFIYYRMSTRYRAVFREIFCHSCQ